MRRKEADGPMDPRVAKLLNAEEADGGGGGGGNRSSSVQRQGEKGSRQQLCRRR